MSSTENKIEAADDIDSLLIGLRRSFFPAAVVQAASEIEKHHCEFPPVSNLTLVQLNKVRFRERKDIHYAMTSLFSALHGTDRPIVFILSGNKEKTTIHLGFWKKADGENDAEELFAAIKGFIPGTEFAPVPDNASILSTIKSYGHINAMVGVPSEKQAFQDEKRTAPIECGIERLADAMTSDNYALMITATPVHSEEAAHYFEEISSILDYAHRLAKTSEQLSSGTQRSKSEQKGVNSGGSLQQGKQESSGETLTETPWCLKRWGKGIARFVVGGAAAQKQTSKQIGTQFTEGTQWGINYSSSLNLGTSEGKALTYEHVNHQAIFAEELLKMIQGRLKNGIGEGLWKTNVLFLSDREESAVKGCNILKGMWSGAQSHQDPVRFIELSGLVAGEKGKQLDNALALVSNQIVEDHPLGIAYSGGYTWMTSGELALEANLPYYELPSLSSENVVEYGRFLPSYDPDNQLMLGSLVDRNIKTETPVWMDTFRLNRHLFVTGLTGAGKSNTVRSILLELARLGIPFLVIEPVKSEYRLLGKELEKRFHEGTSKFEHLDVFSLSGSGAEKLVLNPFAFEIKPGEDPATALISHIDRLKAVFNSSLGMYSSMPYILEEMIYKAYKNAGWNLETGKNGYFEIARKYLGLDEDSELRNLFLPTLSELAGLVDEAIKGFFPDKSDYGISLVGALKSRLNSLSRGAKGLLLNQKLSLPMQALLERPCVIELEAFADNDEKAFIMALLLSRIYEFRSGKLAKGLKHVLVIEEAHRLLAKPPQTGEYSANSRGKSVEVFSDMLAEIRAYGQGIVIADQIPDKLIPDVIKNTDIKIVHRLMAKEDREAVGTAMNLTERQINDLNRATPGLATVSFDGLNSAIRVQIRNVPLHLGENIKTEITPTVTTHTYIDNIELAQGQDIFANFNATKNTLVAQGGRIVDHSSDMRTSQQATVTQHSFEEGAISYVPFVGGIGNLASKAGLGGELTLQDAFWAAADVAEIATTVIAIVVAIPSGGTSVGAQVAATSAKTAAKVAAKTAIKAATKTAVKTAVKTGGKAVVKGTIHIAGKSSAKLAAKTSAKSLAKQSVKQTGKLALKNGGRAGAKATVAKSGSVVRYKNIPKNNGSWLGKPGDSRWMPTSDRVGTKLNPSGKKMGQILAENNMQKGIPFKQGKIDLHAASKGTVRIDEYSLSRPKNFAQADSKLAETIRSGKVNPDIQSALKSMGVNPEAVTKGDIKSLRKLGYTWHERADMKTLDLIKSELHGNVPHSGGISALKD